MENKLYVVIPCYNEEEVLKETSKRLNVKLGELIKDKIISKDSKVLFVNDGSKDKTWDIICELNKKNKLLKNIIRVIICLFSLYGVYVFITSKDYTKEMKQLEEQMSKNEQVILQKQKEYSASIKEEEDRLNEALNKLNLDEEELKEVIKKSPVVGIGDSVMLGAIDNLYDTFKGGYFDAKVSRTA